MEVLFKSRDAQATPLRDLAVRRVRYVLRRLSWLVPRAEVHLPDTNGPRGGVDKRCQVELKHLNLSVTTQHPDTERGRHRRWRHTHHAKARACHTHREGNPRDACALRQFKVN